MASSIQSITQGIADITDPPTATEAGPGTGFLINPSDRRLADRPASKGRAEQGRGSAQRQR